MKHLLPIFFLVFLLIPQLHKAQNFEEQNKRFDSIYFHTAVNVIGTDSKRAFEISDSLYRFSANELQRVKSLMLTSTLYQQTGDNKQAINYALQAGEIAARNKLYEWQARIFGFLSTQYRIAGIYNKGKVHLERGMKVIERVNDENKRNMYFGMVYQETAYYNLYDKEYEKMLESVKLAEEYLNKLPEEYNRDYFLAVNEELYGRTLCELQEYEKAITHFNNALDMINHVTQEETPLNGFIYIGFARVYLFRSEYPKAFDYLTKAENIAENSKFINLQMETYTMFSDYYLANEDYENYTAYNHKYKNIYEQNEKNKKIMIGGFIEEVNTLNERLTGKQQVLMNVFVGVLLIFTVIIVLYRRKKKREFKHFKTIIAELEQHSGDSLQKIGYKEPKKEDNEKNIMSEDVKNRILNDLEEFEKGDKFTDKNMSFSVLVSLIGTNAKYLSYVLNNYKNKDFNSYINELRVNYIIREIQENSEYMNYKISYMADKCGFSSHSKFTVIFKQITGFTPSVFLSYIEKSKKEAVIEDQLVESE